jgi:hypothetical protein
VVAVGDNAYGQCNIGSWGNITQVAAGYDHTVGLNSTGIVVAVGRNHKGQCYVTGWTNITKVTAGYDHTVGLKSNGRVVAVGDNDYGQCNVSSWTDIIQVTAGNYHTVGLKANHTVVAVGDNYSGQCDVGSWTGITQVAAGRFRTVGLEDDGTVVATSLVVHWNLLLALPPLRYPPPPPQPPPSGGGCFIATAAYGTPMAEEIQILREFRDEYLLTNPVGRAMVSLYYRVSPPIAEFITEHPSLKPIVRAGLLPAVVMSTIAVNTTSAEKAAIIGLLALLSVALVVWSTRRRGRGPQHT